MDSGAHFHRCDLQVHTPRDVQWAGTHYQSDEDRRAFASKFIQQCREKGLDAVAITDHHDIAFFPYIKEAARTEQDDTGDLVPEKDQIVVFPGMELTLNVPCQALLLLDPDFDENLLSQLYGILAITQTSPEEARLPSTVVRLDHITTLNKLHEELDRHDFLKGRYIILPNVSDGGNCTLLRSGNHAKYKDMPCVGGYVDGSIDDLGTGNQNILAGKTRDHGFKSIGDPDSEYGEARNQWISIYRERGELLEQKCRELTDLSSGTIRSTLQKGGGIDRAADRLKGSLVGTGIRGKKTEDLFDRIMNADSPVEEWAKVLAELELVVQSIHTDEDTFIAPETPILSQYYNSNDLERMARRHEQKPTPGEPDCNTYRFLFGLTSDSRCIGLDVTKRPETGQVADHWTAFDDAVNRHFPNT